MREGNTVTQLQWRQEQLNAANARTASLEAKVNAVEVFKPTGRGGTWPDKLRELYMKHLTYAVSPDAVTELVGSTIIATVPWAQGDGLQLPSVAFTRALRNELALLTQSEAALSFAEVSEEYQSLARARHEWSLLEM